MTPVSRTHEDVCPKRIWVLTVLSDDEHTIGELPRGLSFHLNRCPSCRMVADRLRRANTALAALGAADEPALFDRAQQQAFQALRAGAALTGRVELADECEMVPAVERDRQWHKWLSLAASVAILVTAVGYWSFRSPLQVPGTLHATNPAQTPAIRIGESMATQRTASAAHDPSSTVASDQDGSLLAAERQSAEHGPLPYCDSAHWPDEIMNGRDACIPRAPWLRIPFRTRAAEELHRIDSPPSAVLSNPPSERR